MTVNSGGCGPATSGPTHLLVIVHLPFSAVTLLLRKTGLTPDVGKSRRDSLLLLSGGLCGLSLLHRKLSFVNRPPSCSGLSVDCVACRVPITVGKCIRKA